MGRQQLVLALYTQCVLSSFVILAGGTNTTSVEIYPRGGDTRKCRQVRRCLLSNAVSTITNANASGTLRKRLLEDADPTWDREEGGKTAGQNQRNAILGCPSTLN